MQLHYLLHVSHMLIEGQFKFFKNTWNHFAVCRDGMLKVLAHKTIQELVQQTEDLRVFLV